MVLMMKAIKLISGSSHPLLAQEIAKLLKIKLTPITLKKFPNDNLFCRIEESIRNEDVFILQTSALPVNDSLVELLLMIDAAKYASAGRITAVLPYYPYVRTDKKDQPRVPVTARLVADMLQTAGAERILTMDLHALQILSFFRMPADQLLSVPIVVDYLKKKDLKNTVIVSPDVGGLQRARFYAKKLNLPIAIMDKRRDPKNQKINIGVIIGEVKEKYAIIIDDEISTGGTLLETAAALIKQGAKEVSAVCIHPIFAKDTEKKVIRSKLKELVVTNTLPFKPKSKRVRVLSIAPILAQAIHRVHNGASVSELFI
ncbi:MAG: ribose-phosphate pyrophosphokinase [Deltaproteobacteria bacterium]|nr:ribose-phosphate pyrophosphokinase [Deltaproteobacteria bacterium]MBI3016901.1 ribose-phosphate pyrophosphokinase [Deltaproteobacteria bacterium]